ncbi:hypothetical protein ACFFK0_26565 [Paenibacillus chartarius]|uniref:Glycosyl hydrolase n=1 Tax=Paenibacillus chartarius TaxID=747481 RepID=A0ABV6DTR4_9BACL
MATGEHRVRLKAILTEMDGLFEHFFTWLDDQYDPDTGGFFYARSSKESGKFTPDIESTAQALNILQRVGMLEEWNPAYKEKAIRFFQNKQDAASGYFYDEDPNMRADDVMVGRAISYSSNALRQLGGRPLYPLPDPFRDAPAYMRSPKDYAAWLESIELSNSWRGCDRLCNSAPYLRQMDAEARKPYLEEALRFFERIQDPETGLWGEGSWYVRISGTFKLHTFYGTFNVPMPRPEAMYRSILYTLRNEQAIDMCYIRNPINLLSSMNAQVPEAEMEEIASITLRNMKALLRPDGGFSRELAHSPVAPNVAQVKEGEFYPDMPKPVPLGLGLIEGDMNAGTQAVLIRTQCYELAGLQAPPLVLVNS